MITQKNLQKFSFTTIPVILLLLLFTITCSDDVTSFNSPFSPISGTLSYNNIENILYGTATNISPSWANVTNAEQTVTYSISPTTTGISINANSGVVTVGDNTAVQSATTYTVTASGNGDYGGTITTTFTIRVNPKQIVGNLSYNNITTTNRTATSRTPSWSGVTDPGQTRTYSISPSTSGISINTSTGVVTVGSNTAAQDATTYTVTANGTSNYQGSRTATFTIEVKPSFLYFITNAIDVGNLEISGPKSTTTAQVGGTTYLFVAGYADDGVSVFSVNNNGTLVNVDNVSDNSTLKIRGASSIATAQVGVSNYIFVTGSLDHGVSMFAVNNNGTLVNVDNISDNDSNLKLNGASSATTTQVGNNTYLFVAGSGDNGISGFQVNNNGTLVNVYNVSNDNTLNLGGIYSVTTSQTRGTNYLFASGQSDSGISVFSIDNNGNLSNIDNISDSGDLEIDGVQGLATLLASGTQGQSGVLYLFAAGGDDDGVNIFLVNNNGTLANLINVSDSDTLALAGAKSIAIAQIGGANYFFVAGNTDNGVSAFALSNFGSSVSNIYNIFDDDNLTLDGAESVTTAQVGDTTYLFVTGYNDNGVSVFSVNP